MNLTDRDTLELNELCSALVDGSITDVQRARLSQWLASSDEARQFYVRYAGMSASLCEYASELQVEAPDVARTPARVIRPAIWWTFCSLAAAALVMVGLWISTGPRNDDAAAELNTGEFVASVTGAKDCRWGSPAGVLRPGDHLRHGQQVELLSGFAEITFDCGAQITLEGPALLDVNSAWGAVLRRGTLRANVPPEAIGFRVSNPAVEVVDLGTEFSMVADASGATEVFVLKGSVEAASAGSHDTLVLREKESRHFSKRGVSAVADHERKLARLRQPVGLDRFSGPMSYVHWSFDETAGRIAKADVIGVPTEGYDARLEPEQPSARLEGRWQGALNFNGRLSVTAAFPGISASAARTMAFWVKIPADTPLSGGSTMVAWGARSPKKHMTQVQIGWNRNPEQGALGALRTERGRDFAIGTTPLRDGQWHHVAVVFVPAGGRWQQRMNVNQYVDGRLEGTTLSRTKAKSAAAADDAAEPLHDILCLGHRLAGPHPKKERFRGALDELFIADRALTPREIVQLIKTNNPALPELAATTRP